MPAHDLKAYRVLPVITALDIDSTLDLVRALQSGGIRAVEITLRSSCAFEAITAVQSQLPDMVVAAGTVRSVDDLHRVQDLGVTLALSPGTTPQLFRCGSGIVDRFCAGSVDCQ